MDCDKCGRSAVIHQEYSGLHLCRQHFIADFESKAKRSIRFSGGLPRGDHIAVAGFMGYRNIALMYFLANLTAKRRGITLSAILPDDCFSGKGTTGKEERIEEKTAASLGFRCVRAVLCDGDPAMNCTPHNGEMLPCAGSECLSGAFLERVAGREGITRIACGSSLDDEALKVLTAFFRGEPGRLVQVYEDLTCRIPRIYPFLHIPSREIALYAELVAPGTEFPHLLQRSDPFSEDAEDFLVGYSARHPSAPHSLVNLGERLRCIGVDREIRETSGSGY